MLPEAPLKIFEHEPPEHEVKAFVAYWDCATTFTFPVLVELIAPLIAI